MEHNIWKVWLNNNHHISDENYQIDPFPIEILRIQQRFLQILGHDLVFKTYTWIQQNISHEHEAGSLELKCTIWHNYLSWLSKNASRHLRNLTPISWNPIFLMRFSRNLTNKKNQTSDEIQRLISNMHI